MRAGEEEKKPDPWAIWTARWRELVAGEMRPVEVLAELWRLLPRLPCRLGFLAFVSQYDGAPPEDKPQTHQRGDDLFIPFPHLHPGTATFLMNKEGGVADAVKGMVNALNYLALYAGGGPIPERLDERDLTPAQRACVMHLVDLVEYLDEDKNLTPSFGEASQALAGARFDYAGDPVVPRPRRSGSRAGHSCLASSG